MIYIKIILLKVQKTLDKEIKDLYNIYTCGEMSELAKEPDLKSGTRVSAIRVRVPISPPSFYIFTKVVWRAGRVG